jgi:quercetin dioxygenase-like cupin family protein
MVKRSANSGSLPIEALTACEQLAEKSRVAELQEGRIMSASAYAVAAALLSTIFDTVAPTANFVARQTCFVSRLQALSLCAAVFLFAPTVAAQEAVAPGAKVSVVFDQELPNLPGKSMRAVLVEYAPGTGSPSHRHPTSAFIYARVLEGAIRSKVNDGPERTYRTGEHWTEKPGDHHQVSKNASDTEPAQLLAIFVVDTGDRQIVIPDK